MAIGNFDVGVTVSRLPSLQYRARAGAVNNGRQWKVRLSPAYTTDIMRLKPA